MRTIYLLLNIVLLLSGCASTPIGEHVKLSDTMNMQTWKLVSYKNYKHNGSYNRVYEHPGALLPGQFIVFFTSGEKSPMKQFVENYKSKMDTVCPGTKHQIIESNEHDLYFTFVYPSCNGREPESDVNRLIQGNEGQYLLSYRAKNRHMKSDEKDKWLAYLRDSSIIKITSGGQYEKIR